jgi:hypothetical protein
MDNWVTHRNTLYLHNKTVGYTSDKLSKKGNTLFTELTFNSLRVSAPRKITLVSDNRGCLIFSILVQTFLDISIGLDRLSVREHCGQPCLFIPQVAWH